MAGDQGRVGALLLVAQLLLLERSTDARAQQCGVEGLGQVVLGAGFNATHHAGELVECGDHDDWHMAQGLIGLHAQQDAVAVELGHHDVQQHQVVRRVSELRECIQAVHRGVDAIAIPLKASRQHVAVGVFVVDNQESRTRSASRLRCAGFLRLGQRQLCGARRLKGGGRSAAGLQARVDGLKHRARSQQDALQVAGLLAGCLRVLEQHLAVADDLVQRRAQVVAQLR